MARDRHAQARDDRLVPPREPTGKAMFLLFQPEYFHQLEHNFNALEFISRSIETLQRYEPNWGYRFLRLPTLRNLVF